ncbi:MAG: hypothetical protein GWP06_13865 [Actinobacteria bacterium]|nr:hypothetical protein [Actinomycetota bacterium]
MTSITLKIPDRYSEILNDADDSLYLEALNFVTQKKLSLKMKEKRKVEKRIKQYEKKYNCSYKEFQKTMGDSQAVHDDWIEWTYLDESDKEISKFIERFQQLLTE